MFEPEQDKQDIESVLQRCWDRLSQLKAQLDKVKLANLTRHEKAQLDELTRITGAYALFIIQIGTLVLADTPVPEAGLADMQLAMDLHCDNGQTCVRNLLDEQAGLAAKGLRAL